MLDVKEIGARRQALMDSLSEKKARLESVNARIAELSTQLDVEANLEAIAALKATTEATMSTMETTIKDALAKADAVLNPAPQTAI